MEFNNMKVNQIKISDVDRDVLDGKNIATISMRIEGDYKVTIPKLNLNNVSIIKSESKLKLGENISTTHIEEIYLKIPIRLNDNCEFVEIEKIKKKMTKSEIEKVLGYEIEIIE